MTERRKPLRWKQIMPNTDRGWVLVRGGVVLGRVVPVHGRMTSRVTGWRWTASVQGKTTSGTIPETPALGAREAKWQCLEWVKATDGMQRDAGG